jgi:hypothetical protein
MKKIIYITVILLASINNIYSQEEEPSFDGFGVEGNGDAQTNPPNVPIDGLTIPLLATGALLATYILRKRHLKQNPD